MSVTMKEEINILKELIEVSGIENIKVVYAEKQQWLLLKTADKNKTFGAIRFNKNTFCSLYIDTKEDFVLKEMIKEDEHYKGIQADVQSRVLGNFVQNKIKFYNDNQIDFVTDIIKMCMDQNLIHIDKKVRSTKDE